jgi:hypothetical protein
VVSNRTTPAERKRWFADNLDRLVNILGLTRKEAAEEIGIPYKLMRRLVSAGVSRVDERNAESLARIVGYFALPGVDLLWRANLLQRLLTAGEGEAFVAKFRDRLLAERERRLAAARVAGHEDVVLVGRAFGLDDTAPAPLSAVDAAKLAAILDSPKADTFRRLIDDYYEMATRTSRPDGAQDAGHTAARA